MASIPAVTESSGAIQKIHLSELSGMMSSLMSSFSASAIGCNKSVRTHAHRPQPRLHVSHYFALKQHHVSRQQRQHRDDHHRIQQRQKVRPEKLVEPLNHYFPLAPKPALPIHFA